ncbi:MAG: glutamate racemase [Candidatus Omnitrophica bacterium]|nr:glutamate racemase [Candidatus Omnitrophota bacterium]
MNNKPIGIFDSGVGGLTVFKQIRKLLPWEDLIYFGDTARVPYGNKSKETIIKFSIENILFLLQKQVKVVVIACNTSSSMALDYLKDIFNIPIIGVIDAGVKKAIKISSNKRIGVIGTRSTINSRSYEKKIKKFDKSIKIYSRACPLFVPLIEEGLLKGEIIDEVIKMYLEPFKKNNIDTLILGCTHYPLLKKQIASYLVGVNIVDSAKEVALCTFDLLKEKKLFKGTKKLGINKFYVSDEPTNFVKLAKLFLKKDIKKPTVIHV